MTHIDELQSQRTEFAEFRQELLAAVQNSERRLVDRIHAVEVTLGERIGNVKADLMKWSFVFWVGAVTAVAVLAGVLK